MQILHEHIIVKTPTIFQDETKYKGVDGQKLLVDVLTNPEKHVRDYAEVVSVPYSLPNMPIAQDHIGQPARHDHPGYKFKYADDIERDLRIGDRVYFHRNCMLPDAGKSKFNFFYLHTTMELEGGKPGAKMIPYHYFRVKYELCFVAVRYTPINAGYDKWQWWMESGLQKFDSPVLDDNPLPAPGPYEVAHRYLHTESGAIYKKELIMIGSWCLVEPDMETWDDISIPTPMILNGKKVVDEHGRVQMKPKEQWLVTKAQPDKIYLRGFVRHIGKPLKGDRQEIPRGAYVMFRPKTDTWIRVEGFDYFRMIQRNIFMWQPTPEQYAEMVN
jgi:hypothetical protein